MSTALNQNLPTKPLASARPGVAPARAECPETYRERIARKPCAYAVMAEARVARAIYQRDLLRRFMKFLVSRRPFARHRGSDDPAASPSIVPHGSACATPQGGRDMLVIARSATALLGIVIGSFAVAAPARSQAASSAQCPAGYAPYDTVCIHDTTGDVVNATARTARLEAETGCVPGYWRYGEVCINLATGDVEFATGPTHTAARQRPTGTHPGR